MANGNTATRLGLNFRFFKALTAIGGGGGAQMWSKGKNSCQCLVNLLCVWIIDKRDKNEIDKFDDRILAFCQIEVLFGTLKLKFKTLY